MWQYPDKPLLLSNPALIDEFLAPYQHEKRPLLDYARGGVDLLDASKGLNVKNWTCELQDGSVYISSPGVPLFKIETILGEPEWISFCFDQNMHYNLAYVLPGSGAFLYWYDANVQGYVTYPLGSVSTPILRMDDVRMYPSFWNDMILSYISGGALCCRLQRDRFSTEYMLAADAGNTIMQCGMHKSLRFQWLCI